MRGEAIGIVRMKRSSLMAIATLLALIATAPSYATLTVFSDRASWEGAIGGSDGIENFNRASPVDMSYGVNGAGLIDIGIIGDPTLNRIDDGSGGADTDGSNYFHGALDFSGATSSDLVTVFINQTIIGFGADWAITITCGELIMIIGSDIVLFTDHFTGRGDGFLGVIATTAFSSVVLDTVLDTVELVRYGQLYLRDGRGAGDASAYGACTGSGIAVTAT